MRRIRRMMRQSWRIGGPADRCSASGLLLRSSGVSSSVDYEPHGRTYALHRRADPRIAARIHAALGDARTVVNVGAGAGSYEPRDREVIAIEPSAVMIAQRDPELASAIQARAYPLPLEDQSVDAAM